MIGARQQRCLHLMGIDVWRLRPAGGIVVDGSVQEWVANESTGAKPSPIAQAATATASAEPASAQPALRNLTHNAPRLAETAPVGQALAEQLPSSPFLPELESPLAEYDVAAPSDIAIPASPHGHAVDGRATAIPGDSRTTDTPQPAAQAEAARLSSSRFVQAESVPLALLLASTADYVFISDYSEHFPLLAQVRLLCNIDRALGGQGELRSEAHLFQWPVFSASSLPKPQASAPAALLQERLPTSPRNLIVLGEQFLPTMSELDLGSTPIRCSYSLGDMLEQPMRKALTWQELQGVVVAAS